MSQLTCDMVPPLQSAYSSPLQGTAATAAVITFTMMLRIKMIAFIVWLNLYVYTCIPYVQPGFKCKTFGLL